MTLKWQEVAVALSLVLVLITAKHIPLLAALPLSRVTGIVCFGYAIFLSLRLIEAPQATSIGGWSELRPSVAEKFAAGILGGLSVLIIAAVVFGMRGAIVAQLSFYLPLAVVFGIGALAIAFTSFLVEVRWNHRHIEHRSSLGRRTTILWSEVAGVSTGWQSVTIRTVQGPSVKFSNMQAGAAELVERARRYAHNNAERAKA